MPVDRRGERSRVEAGDGAIPEDRHWNRTETAGDKLVVRAIVFIDVVGGERDSSA